MDQVPASPARNVSSRGPPDSLCLTISIQASGLNKTLGCGGRKKVSWKGGPPARRRKLCNLLAGRESIFWVLDWRLSSR
jgi:hypothetical protein